MKSAIFNSSLASALALVLVVGVGASVAVAVQPEGAGKPPVSEQSGKITFNPQTGEVGADPERYVVPYGHKLELTLDLEIEGSGDAEFAKPPVRFPQGEPPELHLQGIDKTQVMLSEVNRNEEPGTTKEYFFKARVESGGEVYESPDPTIGNDGPPDDG